MRTVDPLSGITAFLRLADTLNFSRAAESLGVSRATVTAQVQELERRLNIRLLHRTTRSVALTEAGAAYRQALAGILPQLHEAERAAVSFQQEAVGRIRVTAPPELGSNYLGPAIAVFTRNNPGVSIELNLSYKAVDLVRDGFDLALRGTISVDPNLVTRKIGRSPIFVCASPDYLERYGAPTHPEELASRACLHFAELRWGRMWVFERASQTLRVPIIPRFEVNDGRTLLAAALGGAGITLLPSFLVGPSVRSGHLVPVLTDWAVPPVPLNAIYPANRFIAVKVRSFVSFLVSRFSQDLDLNA